jgi:hypothetical protein
VLKNWVKCFQPVDAEKTALTFNTIKKAVATRAAAFFKWS